MRAEQSHCYFNSINKYFVPFFLGGRRFHWGSEVNGRGNTVDIINCKSSVRLLCSEKQRYLRCDLGENSIFLSLLFQFFNANTIYLLPTYMKANV